MLKRTALTLGLVAVALWIATSWLASDERTDARIEPIRAVIQGLAVTTAIIAAVILVARLVVAQRPNGGNWERVSTGEQATYVSAKAPADDSCIITMRIPRVQVARMEQHIPAPPVEILSHTDMGMLYRLGEVDARNGRRRP